MPSESIGALPAGIEPGRAEAVAKLRAAFEDEFPGLFKQVAVFIHKLPGRRTREEVNEIAIEALGEAARRVFENPGKYDPARSAFPWIVAVAMRVVGERTRVSGPRSRKLGLEPRAWHAIEDPHGRRDESRTISRMDLDGILELLDPPDRQALECHYIQGLREDALAEALGIPTVSGARARVCRARKKASALVNSRQGEVSP